MVKHKVPCDLTTTGDGYGAFLRLCCWHYWARYFTD
jgi:hypothetical protein